MFYAYSSLYAAYTSSNHIFYNHQGKGIYIVPYLKHLNTSCTVYMLFLNQRALWQRTFKKKLRTFFFKVRYI